MSIFDSKRLTNKTFKLDIERMRRGWYSDKYFENIGAMLGQLSAEGYRYAGHAPHLIGGDPTRAEVGEMQVEMQWFTRRRGTGFVVGVERAIKMPRHCTGVFDGFAHPD